jgi:hypothetical protein
MSLFSQLVGSTDIPPIERDTPHYEAVGRFITSYASAEAAVHVLARKLSGMSDAKARAIFGDMRLGDLSKRIRQMTKIDNLAAEVIAEIESCLQQLATVAERRHNLVHRSTNFIDGKLHVTNALIAKSKESVEAETLDHDDLAAMHSDCLAIYLRIADIVTPNKERDEFLTEFLARPWRYKPVPPKNRGQSPQKAQKSKNRQPRA